MDDDECRSRLTTARHAILGTLHPERGPDLVPIVHAVLDASTLVFPIDTVKAKRTTELGRLANLERDARASVLVERYDDDWSRLWWVRASGRAALVDDETLDTRARAELTARFPTYRTDASIARVVALRIERLVGWRAV